MPLGSFRLNGLSGGPGVPPSARASAATYSVQQGSMLIYDDIVKFGSMSLQTNSTSAYSRITVNPVDTAFNFSSNKIWTIEGFIRLSNGFVSGGSETFINIGADAGTGFNSIPEFGAFGGSSSGGEAFFKVGEVNSSIAIVSSWGYFAWVSYGNNTMSLYLNGTRVRNAVASTFSSSNKYISIGKASSGDSNYTVIFDEIRISNIARYNTSSITVPTAAFTNDANTLALFHFNGTAADDTA